MSIILDKNSKHSLRYARGIKMKVNEKIKLLEARLQVLSAKEKDNQGVCRRIRREIRKLKRSKIYKKTIYVGYYKASTSCPEGQY